MNGCSTVLPSAFSPKAIHKNKKQNKRTTTENGGGGAGWSRWVPEAGQTSRQPQPQPPSKVLKGLFVWWSEKDEVLRGRAAGRSSVTRTRPGARAGRVSDIVFPLIEVSGPNSWKTGRAGSPFRGFHWARQCAGATWMRAPQPRREGASEQEEPVGLQECVGIWNGLGVSSVQV